MTNKLTENDVRLIRRVLVALNFDDRKSANVLIEYLRLSRKLNMVFPAEQSDDQRNKYLGSLPKNERWLAEQFGCVLMPDYGECIFLNSKWANPRTLWVRLVAQVGRLGKLGEINWLPQKFKDSYEEIANKNHEKYLQFSYHVEYRK